MGPAASAKVRLSKSSTQLIMLCGGCHSPVWDYSRRSNPDFPLLPLLPVCFILCQSGGLLTVGVFP